MIFRRGERKQFHRYSELFTTDFDCVVQAVLAILENTATIKTILDNQFLFLLHFRFDLHECVSGKTRLPYYLKRSSYLARC